MRRAAKLVTAWAKLERVVGAPDRLAKLADDIAEHFAARSEANLGKALAVAYSRRIAADLTRLLRERLGEEAVDCVISAQATDPPEISRFRRSKAELKELAKRFRDPDDPLRVVVVKDMWLTGFDAPGSSHPLHRQANARSRLAPGDRPGQPGLPGQTRWTRRRLHRHRRGPACLASGLRRDGDRRSGDSGSEGGGEALREVRGDLRPAAPRWVPPRRTALPSRPKRTLSRLLRLHRGDRRANSRVPRRTGGARQLVCASSHPGTR